MHSRRASQNCKTFKNLQSEENQLLLLEELAENNRYHQFHFRRFLQEKWQTSEQISYVRNKRFIRKFLQVLKFVPTAREIVACVEEEMLCDDITSSHQRSIEKSTKNLQFKCILGGGLKTAKISKNFKMKKTSWLFVQSWARQVDSVNVTFGASSKKNGKI